MKNTFLTFLLTIISLLVFVAVGLNVYSLIRLNQLTQTVEELQVNKQPSLQPGVASNTQKLDETQQKTQDSEDMQEAQTGGIDQTTLTDREAIKQALADRHNKQASEAMVEVLENTGTYAKGSIKFAGDISGGWWLAVKEDQWKIVADGNGTVYCSDIAPYDFPAAMVPECWDQVEQELVTRSE